jgi:hypothetical protein
MVTHEQAAVATLAEARKHHAKILPSMREALIGTARAWDLADELGDLKTIPQLSARMLDWVIAVQGRIPTEAPADAFVDISRELNRNRRKSS